MLLGVYCRGYIQVGRKICEVSCGAAHRGGLLGRPADDPVLEGDPEVTPLVSHSLPSSVVLSTSSLSSTLSAVGENLLAATAMKTYVGGEMIE